MPADLIQEVESIFHPEIVWAAQEYAKLKTWAGQEIKAGEQLVETEAHKIVSGAVDLATKIAPSLLTGLSTAWKNVVQRAESGTLDAAGIEQAVIQEAEHLGEEVVAAVTTMGSPELQALFAIFKALGLHL